MDWAHIWLIIKQIAQALASIGAETFAQIVQSSFFKLGVSPSLLMTVNAVGLGVLTAGTVLPARQDLGQPPPDGDFEEIYGEAVRARAYVRATGLFGFCCLFSTAVCLLSRQPAACPPCQIEPTPEWLTIAADFTTLGLVIAVMSFARTASSWRWRLER